MSSGSTAPETERDIVAPSGRSAIIDSGGVKALAADESFNGGLKLENGDGVFYSSAEEGLIPLLLGLTCHESNSRGCSVVCASLTVCEAALLASCRPARVFISEASPFALDILTAAGIDVVGDQPAQGARR